MPYKPDAVLVYEHEFVAFNPWSGLIRRGQVVRIIDAAGEHRLQTQFYRADNFSERCGFQQVVTIPIGSQLLSNHNNLMLKVVRSEKTVKPRARTPKSNLIVLPALKPGTAVTARSEDTTISAYVDLLAEMDVLCVIGDRRHAGSLRAGAARPVSVQIYDPNPDRISQP